MNDVQPYAFGQAASEPTTAISGLDRLGKRFVQRLRALIEPYNGTRPEITAKPLEQTMFMMWDAAVPGFVSLSLYRLHPIKGPVTLRLDADLVTLLVDRFYGGNGPRKHHGKAARHEFAPTEIRLITRLSEQIMAALVDCWIDIAPLELALLKRETGVAQAEIMAGETNVAVQAFEVDLGHGGDSSLIEIVYPQDGFAAIHSTGGDRSGDESRPPDPVWRTQLAQRLDDVRLSARTVLARPNLKLSELVALKPGDVIPIHIARHLPLLIDERVFAHGSIGEQDGCVAFMIEKLA